MAVSNQTASTTDSEYSTLQFIIQQILNGIATAAPVRVEACTNTGGLSPAGTVDVSLLVDMITEDGQTIPHGTIFQAPYSRLQGGTNAVILDPKKGDMGVCVFAMRDISSVKKDPVAALTRAPSPGAPPGSRRVYDFSDAMYFGGILNGVPVQYVQFTDAGINMVSPQAVTIQAPVINLKGAVNQMDGDVTMNQDLTVTGTVHGQTDVVADTVSGKNHTHGGVQSGGSNTDPPNP